MVCLITSRNEVALKGEAIDLCSARLDAVIQ